MLSCFGRRDQASLWAETYESGVADVLTIQNNVAGQIARALVLEVAPERGRHPRSVPNPKIYDAYLMGLYEANQRSEPSLRKSVEYFKTAIQGDASYAPPYAGLANSYFYWRAGCTCGPRRRIQKPRRRRCTPLNLTRLSRRPTRLWPKRNTSTNGSGPMLNESSAGPSSSIRIQPLRTRAMPNS